MVRIVFEYADEMSGGAWTRQECVMESVAECIHWYGLDDDDCKYRIVSVEDVD